MRKTQRPKYLVLGAILIGIVAILVIYLVMIMLGLIRVSETHLTVATPSADKMYDGTPLTTDPDGWEIIDGELLAGHTIDAKVVGSQTEVGVSDNTIVLTVLDSEGADVTATYEIVYQLGELAVKGKRLEFSSEGAEKYYDGTPLTNENWEFVGGELLEGHDYTVYTVGQITTVGEAPNVLSVTVLDTLTGEDVTKYYDIVRNEGMLKVAAIRLVVSGSVSGNIDGTSGEVSTDCVVISGNLLEGHRVVCEPIEGTVGEVSIETVFVRVLDADGNDVTEYYDVIYPSGNMTISNPETYFPMDNGDMTMTNPYSGDLNTPLYTVLSTKSGALYLRNQSWGDYDGNDWTDPVPYNSISPFKYATDSLSKAGKTEADVTVTALIGGLPYALPYYYVSGDHVAQSLNDCITDGTLVYDQSYNSHFIFYDKYSSSDRYAVSSSLKAEESAYRMFVYNNYLNVDEDTRQQLLQIAVENGISADDPMLIEKVAEYISGAAEYNLNFAAYPDGVNGVIYFLTEAKEGVCRHYAAAATLMYRSLGIPARYVTGFKADARENSEVTVVAGDAHAWVEVYIDGMGWVYVEVTGGSSGGKEPSGLNGENTMDGMPEDMKDTNEPIAEIMTPQRGALYLRLTSYGDFDGEDWGAPQAIAGNESIAITPFTINWFTLDTYGGGSSYDIGIKMLAENFPYMLPYYTGNNNKFASSNDCSVIGNYTVGETQTFTYTYFDFLSSRLTVPPTISNVEKEYYSYIENLYTTVDGETYDYLSAKIKKLGFNKNDHDIVKTVANYIMNAAVYNEKCGDTPTGENAVEYFLEVSKSGVSRHFATAATLMYRTLGIPARYTVGFYLANNTGSWTALYGKDAHVWVEVYIEGVGWIPVEVTAPKSPVRISLKIPTGSAEQVYNGNTISNPNINWSSMASVNGNNGWRYDIANGRCVNDNTGHWFSIAGVSATGRLTDVNEAGINNNASGVVIYDAEGNNVTSKYNISGAGKLKITPIIVTITASGKTLTGEDKYYEVYSYTVRTENGMLYDELPWSEHKLVVEFTYNSANPVPSGSVVENTISSVDIVDKAGNSVLKKCYKIAYGTHGDLINT